MCEDCGCDSERPVPKRIDGKPRGVDHDHEHVHADGTVHSHGHPHGPGNSHSHSHSHPAGQIRTETTGRKSR